MKAKLGSMVIALIAISTAFMFGTVNDTFDGLLIFLHGTYLTLLTIITILMIPFSIWVPSLINEEQIENGKFKYPEKRTAAGWVLLTTMVVAFAGTYIYLEWSGFLYWFLFTWFGTHSGVAIYNTRIRDRFDELGLAPTQSEESEDHDDLSEFQ